MFSIDLAKQMSSNEVRECNGNIMTSPDIRDAARTVNKKNVATKTKRQAPTYFKTYENFVQ